MDEKEVFTVVRHALESDMLDETIRKVTQQLMKEREFSPSNLLGDRTAHPRAGAKF